MDTVVFLEPDESKRAKKLAQYIVEIQKAMFPGTDMLELLNLIFDIKVLFASPSKKFQANDVGYHGIDHTFHTALCLAQLLYFRHQLGVEPRLSPEKFLSGMTAILLHDVGFLKENFDLQGTGAKYTFANNTRSRLFARKYLQNHEWAAIDIFSVETLIGCTGPKSIISKTSFLDELDEVLGCSIGTADYLGQMSDPLYLEKLYVLYQEFEEAADFMEIPKEKRLYQSANDLIQRTPGFWLYVFNEKLIKDCKSYYRFLSIPYPNGPNTYLERIQKNVDRVSKLLTIGTHSPVVLCEPTCKEATVPDLGPKNK